MYGNVTMYGCIGYCRKCQTCKERQEFPQDLSEPGGLSMVCRECTAKSEKKE